MTAAVPDADTWTVYLILCTDQSLYCGISNRPNERFCAHQNGKGAKYTRIRKPLAMRILSDGLSKSTALKREIEIKKMKPQQKQILWQQAQDSEIKAI